MGFKQRNRWIRVPCDIIEGRDREAETGSPSARDAPNSFISEVRKREENELFMSVAPGARRRSRLLTKRPGPVAASSCGA